MPCDGCHYGTSFEGLTALGRRTLERPHTPNQSDPLCQYPIAAITGSDGRIGEGSETPHSGGSEVQKTSARRQLQRALVVLVADVHGACGVHRAGGEAEAGERRHGG